MIKQLNFDIQKPINDISKVTMLLYGTPKIGKSTFCSRFDDHFFIATENGLSHLETRNQLVTSWGEFLEVVDLLVNAKGMVKTVIIDTMDRLCDMLERELMKKYAVSCLNDLAYGKGTALFGNEMKAALDAIQGLGCGLIFVSHAESIDITTPTGTVKKWAPSLPKNARKLVLNAVDVIGFAECEYIINAGKTQEARVLHLAPSQIWEAGDRTHRFPPKIPFKQAVFKAYFEGAIQSNTAAQAQKAEVRNG